MIRCPIAIFVCLLIVVIRVAIINCEENKTILFRFSIA
nr:MAG TPA: hypothetical protein [Caudoviricetes sp.]